MFDYECDIPNWGYGSQAWKDEMLAMDRRIVTGVEYDLSGYLGVGAKDVVINDYLPPGQMYVTSHEVILSKVGWEKLIAWIKRKKECEAAVSQIVERDLGDVLTWLREAGHEI